MDTKELELKLAELKASLEESLTKKQKAEIELQLKTITDQLQALKESMPKPDAAQADKIKELETTIVDLKKAADANQPVIDAFVGAEVLVLGVAAGFVVQAVLALVLLATRRVGLRGELPFGPAMLIGAALVIGWSDALIR